MRSLGATPTFPADAPHHQLDHILTDDRTLRVEKCSAPRLPVSDHRALVVDISRDTG
jgi:endonuclease/exonuclease/phosphatase family metal-dependent hydrolase